MTTRQTRTLLAGTILAAAAVILAACGGAQPAASPTPPAPTPAVLPPGVFLQDDFSNPASGWPEATRERGRMGYHPPDFYHVEAKAPNETFSVFSSQTFADFTVETRVLVDHTESDTGAFAYGLAFREAAQDAYYAFTISPRTRTWEVLKRTSSGFEVLRQGVDGSIQGLSQPDLLRVDASGTDLTFHVNGHRVAHVADAAYPSGRVGFIVRTQDETLAHIHYDDLTIRQVEIAGLLYRDEFTDPASAWPVQTGSNSKVGYHPPDVYHVEVSAPDGVQTVLAPGQTFGDFTAEADVFVDHPDAPGGDFRYGLAVRASGQDYYAFAVAPRTQTWQILKSGAGGIVPLAEGTDESIKGLAGPSATDRLRVDAAGPVLTFSINGRLAGQVIDEAYTRGGVGFMVQTFDQDLMHVHFDTLTVRELDGPPRTVAFTPTAEPPTLEPSPSPTAPPPPGMVLIPEGTFAMGSDDRADEKPVHSVTLSAYYIDQHEVTNGRYRACVDAGACSPPAGGPYARADMAQFPVTLVTWHQAQAFCAWDGLKRLPTEAEWEFAARGTDGRRYPWGDNFDPARLPTAAQSTVPVGSFPENLSPFGVLDLAGNVVEWVADWYAAAYYAESPAVDPAGPEAGTQRVMRGGSFGTADSGLYTTTRRFPRNPLGADVDIGFRCAATAP